MDFSTKRADIQRKSLGFQEVTSPKSHNINCKTIGILDARLFNIINLKIFFPPIPKFRTYDGPNFKKRKCWESIRYS